MITQINMLRAEQTQSHFENNMFNLTLLCHFELSKTPYFLKVFFCNSQNLNTPFKADHFLFLSLGKVVGSTVC